MNNLLGPTSTDMQVNYLCTCLTGGLWIYAHHIIELSSMLPTLTHYLYTTRSARKKHSRIPFWTHGNHPKRAWSRVIASEPRARCRSIGMHISIPWDFYQSCDWLGARYIEYKQMTHHQTDTLALSDMLCHSMMHRRLWEVTVVFSHLYRHTFISLHHQPIAIVVYITPTHMLCHPSMLTTPVSIYSDFLVIYTHCFPTWLILPLVTLKLVPIISIVDIL